MDQEQHHAAREYRLKGIRRFVLSSIGSKVVTFGVQIVAIPVAFEALGERQFGIYLMIVSALAWMSLGRLGLAI